MQQPPQEGQWASQPLMPGQQPYYPQPGMAPQQQPYYPQPGMAPQQQPYYPQPGMAPQQQPYYPQPGMAPQQQPYYPQPGMQPQQPYYPQPGMQQPYPPQPGYYPPQTQANFMQTNVNVNIGHQGPGFLTRAIYFIFIGWWLGFWWLNLGFFLCMLIVTLPLGLVMLNRLPQIMTLKARGTSTSVNVSTTTMQGGAGMYTAQTVNVNVGATLQQNFLIRALYFILVGWWAGYIWAMLAYFCCVSLILLPVGLVMMNTLPMVLTLRKN